jgi:hypothetical protein
VNHRASPVGIGTTAICIDTVPLPFEKLQATRGNLKRVEYACMAAEQSPIDFEVRSGHQGRVGCASPMMWIGEFRNNPVKRVTLL